MTRSEEENKQAQWAWARQKLALPFNGGQKFGRHKRAARCHGTRRGGWRALAGFSCHLLVKMLGKHPPKERKLVSATIKVSMHFFEWKLVRRYVRNWSNAWDLIESEPNWNNWWIFIESPLIEEGVYRRCSSFELLTQRLLYNGSKFIFTWYAYVSFSKEDLFSTLNFLNWESLKNFESMNKLYENTR